MKLDSDSQAITRNIRKNGTGRSELNVRTQLIGLVLLYTAAPHKHAYQQSCTLSSLTDYLYLPLLHEFKINLKRLGRSPSFFHLFEC